MLHRFVAGMVVAGCLLVHSASYAQDTGLPGPEGGTKAYDVTVIGFVGSGNGTYTFVSEGTGTEEPGTTATLVALEGTFTGVVNDVTTTGTFTGQAVGANATYTVNGTSTAGTVTIKGVAGADYIFGVIKTQPTTAPTGALRFLRALLNTSVVVGSAAAEEPPTEEPPTEEPPVTAT